MIKEMVIEQVRGEVYRNRYNPVKKEFEQTGDRFLLTERGFDGYYGWIKESGTPPEEHLDILFISDKEYALGDVVSVKIVGIFKRDDEDHKIVGIEVSRTENDLFELSDATIESLKKLYPRVSETEGWFGRSRAEQLVDSWLDDKLFGGCSL